MQAFSTRKLFRKVSRLIPVFLIFLLLTGQLNAQTYVNGVLSSGATALNGAAAPAGTTWSELQNVTGVTTVANSLLGAGAQVAATNSVADDFTVPAGATWNVYRIIVYAYSTGGPISGASPFNDVRIRIHNGNPSAGPTTIVFGDLTTNRLSASSATNVFRTGNTLVPAGTPGTTRMIWQLEANVNVTLAPGTYWLEYKTGTSLTSNFTPTSVSPGVRTLPTHNAIQSNGTTWTPLVDGGINQSGLAAGQDVATELPFSIDYNCGQGVFTTVPSNKSVQCSGSTTFNVAASGSLLTYSWQYRTSASGPWLTVPNAAPYSGATTNALTLTNVPSTMDGYQYRALITGPCTAVDFSSPPATLTVTPLVATVTPTSATICTGSIQKIELTNVIAPVKLLEESFNTAIPLPTGWAQQNLSNGLGLTNWFQGNPTVFNANSGAANAYIAANFNNTTPDGTISNWLFTPAITVKNGDKFTFFTRAAGTVATRAERLEVRLSTNGASTNAGATATSVGDFTTVLLEINPLLLPGNANYPNVWTQFTATITGAPTPVTGRIAFRYFVTNGGNVPGINSNFIGIDDVVYTAGGIAQGVWTANPAAPNTMFTDAAATVPYVAGALANAIWVKPTVNTSYSVVYSTTTPCVSAPTTVPVTVVTPVSAPVAPANRTACVGGSVTFTTSATGGPLNYQWQVSTNGGASFTNLANAAGTVAGATTNTLTLSGLTATMNNNQYRAVISAPPCAGSTVNTTAAVLTVNPIPVITIASPVSLLLPGGSTTITATSTTAGLTYVWSRNGAVNGLTGSPITVNIDSLGTYRVTGTLPGVSGCVGQSNSLVIGAQTSDRLWIYPNPTDGQFQVRLYYDAISTPERREFAIFNPNGQQVATKSLDIIRGMSPYVQTNFDLRHLAAGTYVVKVTEKRTGKIVSGLIVIQ